MLCVTRYTNKTQFENIMYNNKQVIKKEVLSDINIFTSWRLVKIPMLESICNRLRFELYNNENIDKREYKKKILIIKRDIELLRSFESDYYNDLLETLRFSSNCKSWIYNVPISIHNSIKDNKIYVIEMNNDENKITGISYIGNRCYHRRYGIHSDNNYNRYSYIGKRMSVDNLNLNELKKDLENVLFKGSMHQKRGQGIQLICKKNLNRINERKLLNILDEVFMNII